MVAARQLQRQRGCLNSRLRGPELRRHCGLGKEEERFLRRAVEKLKLSPRAFDRLLRVARTIADLGHEKSLTTAHLSEALGFRQA